MAKPTVLIDNEKTKVTEWFFEVGDSTGMHVHEHDYVVVPMLDGELKILDKNNNETISKLTKGGAYYRDKGVEHNVFNNNEFPYTFIEIEIIK
ncbi:cupin [Pelagibacterales bacterium SAG-MED31]|nr:cupin [Pelagibacterales bacterium SAG-MED31]